MRFEYEELTVKRALFLDIDGVLNSDRYFEQNRETVDQELDKVDCVAEIEDSGVLIDSEAIARVNTILRAVDDLTVFVSSNWRRVDTLQEIQATLVGQGLEAPVFAPVTHITKSGFNKERDIKNTVTFYEPDSVVILDDHNLFCTRQDPLNLNDCLIQTDGEVGLTDEDVQQAVDHFSRSSDPDESRLRRDGL